METAQFPSDLPERFAQLYDPQTGLFETPLDDRGIADVDALCELAIRTYPDTLPPFTSTERNTHHVYWTEAAWKALAAEHSPQDAMTIHTFRNSTPQLLYIPKPLHWWIEKSTIPPPPPHLEVMRRRNAAWSAASILLKGAILVDQAREDYDTKKDTVRFVIGFIDGITPRSKRKEQPVEEVVDREYWLSELNSRLEGWRKLSDLVNHVPAEDRFITEAKLTSVRALKRRIRNGAMIPAIPTGLIAA